MRKFFLNKNLVKFINKPKFVNFQNNLFNFKHDEEEPEHIHRILLTGIFLSLLFKLYY